VLFPDTLFAMADEWRVNMMVLGDHTNVSKKLVEDLRGRLGDDVAVSVGYGHIFLYAETEKAAEEAEHAAREVLTLQSLTAESLLERWDPAGQAWRDPRAEVTEDEGDQQPGRLRTNSARLANVVIQVLTDGHP